MSASLGQRSTQAVSIVAAPFALVALLAVGCAQNSDARVEIDNRPPPQTADDVLKRVVEAYHQADRYQDNGRLTVQYKLDGQTFSETNDFSLAVAGPNLIRLRAYDVLAVCDGQKFLAVIDGSPDEVLSLPVPDEMSLVSIFLDPVLAKALNQIVGSVPLSLFLEPEPLPALLVNARAPRLDSPQKIAGDLCYRVRIEQREGTLVLWIDQRTYVVRRVEYPIGGYLSLVEPYTGPITDMTITAELESARLDPPIDDATFEFDVPRDAELVGQLDSVREGGRIPKFKFRSLDGREITRDSLAGKIAIIKFWQQDDVLKFYDDLVEFDQIRRRFEDDDSLVFLAVTADPQEISDADLQSSFARLGVSLPIARVAFENAYRSFGLQIVPSTVILGRDGVLQERMVGVYPNQAATLPKKLDILLAGGNLTLEAPQAPPDTVIFAGVTWQFAKGVDEDRQSPAAEATIAPPGEPGWLRLKRLWVCSELKHPGNIVVAHDAGGNDRVFVLDGASEVAEIEAEGKPAAKHQLDLPGDADAGDGAITFLRTATDQAGNRYFLGSKNGGQQLHLFDSDWKRLVSFPEAGTHPGIADAALADLDGDGELEIAAGYVRDVGVHLVTLDGERLWRNRDADEVFGLDVTRPDDHNQRRLLVAQGAVLPIDAEGNNQPPIPLASAVVRRIFTADFHAESVSEWCAIAQQGLPTGETGSNMAVGLSPRGHELWRYPLPDGKHRHAALEMVVAGNLLASNAGQEETVSAGAEQTDDDLWTRGQWVIAAADGSIHFVGMDGTPIDRFNYGAAPSGLAIAQLNGQPALIVATDDRVEAWQFWMPPEEESDGE